MLLSKLEPETGKYEMRGKPEAFRGNFVYAVSGKKNFGEGSTLGLALLFLGASLLEQYAGDESGESRQQPLNPPGLNRLKICQVLHRVNGAHSDRRQKATQSCEEGNEGSHRKAKPFLHILELQDTKQAYRPRPSGVGADFRSTFSSAAMAKSCADHEFRLAAIANLNHSRNGGLGLGWRRTPELLPCVVDNLRHMDIPEHLMASQ